MKHWEISLIDKTNVNVHPKSEEEALDIIGAILQDKPECDNFGYAKVIAKIVVETGDPHIIRDVCMALRQSYPNKSMFQINFCPIPILFVDEMGHEGMKCHLFVWDCEDVFFKQMAILDKDVEECL